MYRQDVLHLNRVYSERFSASFTGDAEADSNTGKSDIVKTVEQKRRLKDLFIFETRLRENYRILKNQQIKWRLVVVILFGFTLYFGYELFVSRVNQEQNEGYIDPIIIWLKKFGVQIGFLFSSVGFSVLVWKGLWAHKLHQATEFIPRCNRGLRQFHIHIDPASEHPSSFPSFRRSKEQKKISYILSLSFDSVIPKHFQELFQQHRARWLSQIEESFLEARENNSFWNRFFEFIGRKQKIRIRSSRRSKGFENIKKMKTK